MSYRTSIEADKQKKLKEAKERYDAFVEDDFDKKQIAEYFRVAIKAQVFIDENNGRILTDKDDLMFAFYDKNFQYTLRRRPVRR